MLRCTYKVSIDYVILGANSTDLPRNETPESISNSDVFIGVDFRFVELPDNFDCFGVINKYTLAYCKALSGEPESNCPFVSLLIGISLCAAG